MDRNISPPPTKRRKISTQITGPLKTPLSPLLPPPLSPDIMRIFSWNINGIKPFLQKSITSFFETSRSQSTVPPPSLRGFLQRHDWPAMLFLQEVKIAAKDTRTQDAVRAAVNARSASELSGPKNKGPIYEAHFTLPSDLFNARGPGNSSKVYGVCSILRTDLRDKYGINVRTVDWDREGRISVVELTSSSEKLAVFNLYAVNGTENPYRDPVTGVIRGTRHDRKMQVHKLLMEECLALEKEGWDVLVAGDMNIAPDARDAHPKLRISPQQHVFNRRDFHEKLLEGKNGLNGVDIWREMHGEERRYTYFPRSRGWGTSCDRVDYFVVGRRTWEKGIIKACGIFDSEAERGPSDHVPIWADVMLETKMEEQTRDT